MRTGTPRPGGWSQNAAESPPRRALHVLSASTGSVPERSARGRSIHDGGGAKGLSLMQREVRGGSSATRRSVHLLNEKTATSDRLGWPSLVQGAARELVGPGPGGLASLADAVTRVAAPQSHEYASSTSTNIPAVSVNIVSDTISSSQ